MSRDPGIEVRWFPGADRVLPALAAALSQPDDLCGPFATRAALHAVLPADAVPSLTDLALAAGTAVWPHDVPEWRPRGAAFDRTGWERLPVAADPGSSGTDAGPLADGVRCVTGDTVDAVPVHRAGPWSGGDLVALLSALLEAAEPIGVVANVHTGPLAADRAPEWQVGHFVVLAGLAPGGVLVADSYETLDDGGLPRGCRVVGVDALAAALSVPPGRGLLLLTEAEGRARLERLLTGSGHTVALW